MRRTLALLAAAAASLGLAGHPGAQEAPQETRAVGAVATLDSGAMIAAGRFVALGGEEGTLYPPCSQCHGLDGAGDASGAFPRLADQGAWYLYSTLHDFASGARPNAIMTPIAAQLSDLEMEAVAAYYASLDDAPRPPVLPRAQPEIDAGLGVAARVGCAGCHGEEGVGRGFFFPFLAGQYAPYLENQLRMFRDGTRGGDPLGVMHAVAMSLSDEDIAAVSAYFASLRPADVTPDDPTEAAAPAE